MVPVPAGQRYTFLPIMVMKKSKVSVTQLFFPERVLVNACAFVTIKVFSFFYKERGNVEISFLKSTLRMF